MQASRATEIPFEQFSRHREGEIKFCRLLQGEQGTPGNYELSMVRTHGDYFTPRHRHNFDQVRLTLEGSFNYGRGKDTPVGQVVYYPEGAPYGPQNVTGDPLILILQFGGATGDGFLTYDQVAKGYEELAQEGEFREGTFHGTDPDTGKPRNQDGYEAIWERVTGDPVRYVKPRYPEPIPMDPEQYAWIAVPGAEGVARKLLGVFTERALRLELVRLDAGARLRIHDLPARELHFLLEGAVRLAGEDFGAHDAFRFDPEDSRALEAIEETHLFVIGLPDFVPASVPDEAV